MERNRGSWLIGDTAIAQYQQILIESAGDDYFPSFRHTDVVSHFIDNRMFSALIFETTLDLLPRLESHLDQIVAIDRIGNQGWTSLTPTTMYYALQLAIASDIHGDLSSAHVVEIGAGYGGWAALLLTIFPDATLSIYDIPEAEPLQERFLDAAGVSSRVTWNTLDEVDCRDIDLVVSCCALSEFDETLRNLYASRVLVRAKYGFLTWNFPGPDVDGWEPTPESALAWLSSHIPTVTAYTSPIDFSHQCILKWTSPA